MSFNGAGVYTRSFTWATDKTNAIPVTASRMDIECDGFATGLSTCLTKDGQQTATARIPFTLGVSAMAGSSSSVSFGQVNDLNTGVYFPGTDQVAITCGGTDVVTSTATVVTIPTGITLKSNTTPYDVFPSGTSMLFFQTSAPSGWTKQSTHNDKAIRLVTGTASSGGTVAFSTCFSRTATDAHQLTTAEMPSHTHTFTGSALAGHTHTFPGDGAVGHTSSSGQNVLESSASTDTVTTTSVSGGTPAGTNSSTGSDGTHTHPMDIRVQFVDAIIANKN